MRREIKESVIYDGRRQGLVEWEDQISDLDVAIEAVNGRFSPKIELNIDALAQSFVIERRIDRAFVSLRCLSVSACSFFVSRVF